MSQLARKRQRRYRALCAFGLFIAAIALYSHSLRHGFVWDDDPIIMQNPFLAEQGSWWRCFGRDFGMEILRRPVGYYRPAVLLSFIANFAVGGREPFVYHLTNVTLHGLNTVLVFVVLARLAGLRVAALAAAVFAVHPVHVESVAFVSGRTDLLCAFFILLCILATMRLLRARGWARARWLSVVLLTDALALLSKELAVALPAVFLAYGLIHRYRLRSLVRLCWPTAALTVAYVVFRVSLFPWSGYARPEAPSGNIIERAIQSLFFYAAQQAFPVIPTLGAEVISRRPWVDIIAAAMFVGLIVGAKPRRHAAGALAWLLLFLGPNLWVNLFKGMEQSDRFAYVPSLGICVLAAMVAARHWDRFPLTRLAACVVVVAFAALSFMFCAMWRDSSTFWQASVKYHPKCGRCYYNVAHQSYLPAGNRTAAARALQKAIALLPPQSRVHLWSHTSLAILLAESAEDDPAIETCRRGLKTHPESIDLRRILASLLSEKGQHTEAIAELRLAEQYDPENPAVQLNLAEEYLALTPPQVDLARRAYERARELGAPPQEKIEKEVRSAK